jgi:hypothetical protein
MQLRHSYKFSLDRKFFSKSTNSTAKQLLNIIAHQNKGGEDQLRRDALKTITFPDFQSVKGSVDNFLASLTKENKQRIEEFNKTQGHLDLVSAPIVATGFEAGVLFTAPNANGMMQTIGENDEQEIFLRIEADGYPVLLMEESGELGKLEILPAHVEIIYKLTDTGWVYQDGSTDSACLHQMFAGESKNLSKVIEKELISTRPEQKITKDNKSSEAKVSQKTRKNDKSPQIASNDNKPPKILQYTRTDNKPSGVSQASRDNIMKANASLTKAAIWLMAGVLLFVAGVVFSVFLGPIPALIGFAAFAFSLKRAQTHYFKAVEFEANSKAAQEPKEKERERERKKLPDQVKKRPLKSPLPLSRPLPPKPVIKEESTLSSPLLVTTNGNDSSSRSDVSSSSLLSLASGDSSRPSSPQPTADTNDTGIDDPESDQSYIQGSFFNPSVTSTDKVSVSPEKRRTTLPSSHRKGSLDFIHPDDSHQSSDKDSPVMGNQQNSMSDGSSNDQNEVFKPY